MLKLLKFRKFIASFFLVLFLSALVFAPVARAQDSWYSQSFQGWYTKVYDSPDSEIFGERYTAAQIQWVVYGLFSFIINSVVGPEAALCLMNEDLESCGDAIQNIFAFVPNKDIAQESTFGSFFGFMLQDRPLSGITYFKNIARKFNVIPEVEAQTPGFGFGALDPILPLWRGVRNATYALLVIAILVLAFMIMFRVKIAPQVVISVQSALPKIATAAILITFSYAIAGFLVDLMYVTIGFLSITISSAFSTWPGWVQDRIDIFGFLTEGFLGWGAVGLSVLYLIMFGMVSIYAIVGANGLGGIVLGLAIPLGSLLGILIFIILAILLIFIVIKILWMLLKAFANVLLLVIAAPLQIVLGVISPAGGIGTWMKSYLANLAVFPVTGILFVMSYIFLFLAMNETRLNFLPDSLRNFLLQVGLGFPPTTGLAAAVQHQGWPPLLVFGAQNSLALLYLGVSVVVLFLIPKTADIIKGMIEGKPFVYGTAVSEATGILTRPAATAAGSWWEATSGQYLKKLGQKVQNKVPEGPGGVV